MAHRLRGLSAGDVRVALNDHEHVVYSDAHKEEGDDGVHGTENEAEPRTDTVARQETEEAAAEVTVVATDLVQLRSQWTGSITNSGRLISLLGKDSGCLVPTKTFAGTFIPSASADTTYFPTLPVPPRIRKLLSITSFPILA